MFRFQFSHDSVLTCRASEREAAVGGNDGGGTTESFYRLQFSHDTALMYRASESEAAVGLCPDEAMGVEHVAKNPPPSLVPRIHAVWIKKLDHANPYLPHELSRGCPVPGKCHSK